jgi:hypothetical protein
MKKWVYYSVALMALFIITACVYNCCDVKPPLLIFAQKNNVQWKATPAGTLGTNDTMQITGVGINTGSNLHDTIDFKFKYAGERTYNITPTSSFYHTMVANSPPLLYYKVDTAFDNYITISDYDQLNHQVTGFFQVKFISPADTTTVTFLNGNFRSPLN